MCILRVQIRVVTSRRPWCCRLSADDCSSASRLCAADCQPTTAALLQGSVLPTVSRRLQLCFKALCCRLLADLCSNSFRFTTYFVFAVVFLLVSGAGGWLTRALTGLLSGSIGMLACVTHIHWLARRPRPTDRLTSVGFHCSSLAAAVARLFKANAALLARPPARSRLS